MRKLLATAIAVALASPTSAPAQSSGLAQPQLTVHPIREGKLYWVEGAGGNSGVIIAPRGVIVVDAKTTAEAGSALVAEIGKLTTKPITHVILTHSDGDHVNGLAGFPDGLKIIAHVNNKAELLATYRFATVEVGGGRCLPPANRLPNQIVMQDRVTTTIDGEPIELLHFAPAHTSGDLIIFLPSEHVAFTGDILTSTVLIHPEKMGTFAGWFENARGLLALNADFYIGGHAKEPDTKATLRARIAGYQAIKGKVDGLVDAGKSIAEVKQAMGDPPKDPSGCRGIPYPSLAEVEFVEHSNLIQQLK